MTNREQTWTIRDVRRLGAGLVLVLSGLAGCGHELVGFPADDRPPTVSSTSPADRATGVASNGALVAVFSEPMNAATLSVSTFTLRDGGALLRGIVTYVGVSATFDPASPLEPNTSYVATIAGAVEDVAGNAMGADYTWTFTTGASPDVTRPRVTATAPGDAAIAVPLNASLSATFSEPMRAATIGDATFTLTAGAVSIAGAIGYVGVTATFDPTGDLAPGTVYTATIGAAATDLAGNTMAADHVWTFTTGAATDTERPSVTFTAPPDDATGVAVEGNVLAVFSEGMDPATISTTSFTVQQLDTAVPGTVTYTNRTATFHPTVELAPRTTYSATITTLATDLAGNALVRNFVWNFRTGATRDTTCPAVVFTVPTDSATDVVRDTSVSATFNEVMDPLTITSATFTVAAGAVPVAGSVTQIGPTAVFEPTALLAPDTEYTATITDVVADLGGNRLRSAHVWTFTTGSSLDAGPPTVALTHPAAVAANVPTDSTVSATFSEPMDPRTVTTASFRLAGPGTTPVPGTVAYDAPSRIATFRAESQLLAATVYTATITTAATDLAGNVMLVDHVWTFSTGDGPAGLAPLDLATLSSFVAVAGAGLTSSNSGGTTTLHGDVGLAPTATCLGDGVPCTATNPVINGTLYANDPGGIAAEAVADLGTALADAMARPPGTTVDDVSGMVLAPGVYTSGSTMSIAVLGTVTLDAGGDPNAVWIFQVGSSLTINDGARVVLVNGARASRVFWAVAASSTIGTNVDFHGSVLAGESNSVGTGSRVVGRLLSVTAALTLLSNTITLPPL